MLKKLIKENIKKTVIENVKETVKETNKRYQSTIKAIAKPHGLKDGNTHIEIYVKSILEPEIAAAYTQWKRDHQLTDRLAAEQLSDMVLHLYTLREKEYAGNTEAYHQREQVIRELLYKKGKNKAISIISEGFKVSVTAPTLVSRVKIRLNTMSLAKSGIEYSQQELQELLLDVVHVIRALTSNIVTYLNKLKKEAAKIAKVTTRQLKEHAKKITYYTRTELFKSLDENKYNDQSSLMLIHSEEAMGTFTTGPSEKGNETFKYEQEVIMIIYQISTNKNEIPRNT